MKDFFTIKIDKESDIPMYQQLADGILALVEDGVLKPNTRLPSIRKMAEGLKVNNVTVVSAYRQLENKKVVYSNIGSGTYISELNMNELPEPILKNQYTTKNIKEFDNIEFDIEKAINFANSSTPPELFPVDDFKILFNEVLERERGNAFSYQDSQGYEPLRESICHYLKSYGIKTASDKIQIISGAQQGIDIIAKVMLSVGDVLFVEKPTYYGAVGAFLSRGSQVIEIPLEKDGLDIEKLESLLKIYKPKFIYVIPYFQTPTCISYSMEKKRQFLELCYKYDTYIIEEDNQSEFNYSIEQILPLKSLDYKNHVIYIKSLSKILMPGLRLGFMVLPRKILQQVLSAKYTTDISTSGFIQRAFDLYLRGPKWESHILKMKNIFNGRYQVMAVSIDKHLKSYVKYYKPKGGLNFWLKIKNKNITIEELCNRLVSRNIIVTPGSLFQLSGDEMPYIRLSFAAVEKDKIEEGVRVIGEVLREYE